MLEKVGVYQNKVFLSDLVSSLVAFEYSKSCDANSQQKFKECFKLKIPLAGNFEVKNVFFDTVENYTIGLKCMIVVVVSEYNDIAVFVYCSALSNRLLCMHRSPFPLPSIEINVNLFVTHGPMLVVLFRNELQMYALSHGTKNCINIGAILDNNKSFKIMMCSSIGQFVSNDSLSVILLVLQCDSDDGKKYLEIITIAVNLEGNDMPVMYHKVPLSPFFPKPFHNIVNSVVITNISASKRSASNLQDICWDDNFSFVCTIKDCLVFRNGDLKYVCHLPYQDTCWSIRTDFCQILSNSIHLLLVSKYKNVYLLDKVSQSDELKLTKSWENVSCVLSGEFMLNDLKRLLLRDSSLAAWQDDCILTNISSVLSTDVTLQNSIPATAVERTIPGVIANIKAGKLAIADTELEISRKVGATLDALYKIKSQVPEKGNVTHHITSFQESLLDILLYSDRQFAKNTLVKKIESLTLENQWKRIINHRILLCWTFTNGHEKPFCYPTIKIYIQDQHVNCIQKVFVHKSSTFSIDDECRQIIYSKEKFSLLVNLEIPRFHHDTIQVNAIVCGSIGQSIDYVLPLEENNFTDYQQLLQTSISCSEGIYEEIKDISTLEDLACLKVMQQRTVFSVSCFNSDISNFETFLLSATENVSNLLIFEGSTKRTLVFKNALSPFYGVSITFQATENELEIETFTRNVEETFLLVKYLYHCLPEDTIILPCGLTASERLELKQQVVCAMKEEVDLLLSGIHINSVQQSNKEESTLISRKQFFKIRNSVSRKEAITDNLMQNLYQINMLSNSLNELK